MNIKLKFSSVDGARWYRRYATKEGARAAIIKQLGNPEVGWTYAISGDGICKVMVSGDATILELFPPLVMKPAAELAAEIARENAE